MNSDQVLKTLIEKQLVPWAKFAFNNDRRIKSVMYLVAQYWDDQGSDECHLETILSTGENPSIECYNDLPDDMYFYGQRYWDEDRTYPNLLEPNLQMNSSQVKELYENLRQTIKQLPKKQSEAFGWYGIPAFNFDLYSYEDLVATIAPYCKDGSNQEMPLDKAYVPFVIINASNPDSYKLSKMTRPELEGAYDENKYY